MLILQKVPAAVAPPSAPPTLSQATLDAQGAQVAAPAAPENLQDGGAALKYTVTAGTSEKMLEHLLETRIDGRTQICPLLTGKSGLVQHDQVSGYIQCHGDNFLEGE